jgi:hypothetical protein
MTLLALTVALPSPDSYLPEAQFSIRNPRILLNSFSLFVTKTNSPAFACAAIHKSLFPMVWTGRMSDRLDREDP